MSRTRQRRAHLLRRRLHLLPCRARGEGRGQAEARRRAGAEDAPSALFRVPNISPDPETGIGGWSTLDFVNAVMRGVSPGGAHFYPAFPYPSYARMRIEDVIDLKAFMDTLPPVSNRVAGHELGFPFNIRRGVGLWKRLYLSDRAGARARRCERRRAARPVSRRGARPLRRVPHLARLDGRAEDGAVARRRAQARRARAPSRTSRRTRQGIDSWSEGEIVDALKTGFKPDFDTLGGRMVAVQENLRIFPTRICRRSPPTSRPSRRCPTPCRSSAAPATE